MSSNNSGGNHAMTKADSQRVQSSQATGGHGTGSSSFAARAQSAGDRHQTAQSGGSKGGNGGQGGQATKK